jgi:phosphoribosyl-ATP pyrophosphohydrolase/phosphoribosyl-AMP cyclohydrolase
MSRVPNFSKGLVPAIVQDSETLEVLMVGYMNQEAYEQTLRSGRVTFYSRSREALWVKGETSGNFLTLANISLDCDEDAVLVKARPHGPVCHTGSRSCFGDGAPGTESFLRSLTTTIRERRKQPSESSYTSSLFKDGIDRIVQKVGEEAVEVVIEGKNGNNERLLDESSDLLFHLMVLWESRELSLDDVAARLKGRSRETAT